MKLIRLSVVLVVMATSLVTAQNTQNPWQIAVGLTMPSVTNDIVYPSTRSISADNFSSAIGLPQASLYRKIYGGLSIGGQLSLGKLTRDNPAEDWDFFSWHAAAKYGFMTDNKFSPYVKAGLYGTTSLRTGADSFSEGTDYSNFGTIGFDYALGENIGAYAEYSIGQIISGPEAGYSLLSVGVSLGFGDGDRDKDGVRDKKDTCPDVPGLKEFKGCPDTDGDGIPDNEDDCPEDAGPAENKGCPDTDGDGVLDKDDDCPEVAGLEELKGCPDADEDGVADKDDKCADVAGPVENEGCPWPDTDGDGVLDKDDACPEEAGSDENGCPQVKNEILQTLNEAGSTIYFAANSSRLMGGKVMDALEEVKAILEANPEGVVIIEGHASEDGSESYNLKLSENRANSVREKLIELGVDAARLEISAMGETSPVGDNTTREGRKESRRVIFKGKQR